MAHATTINSGMYTTLAIAMATADPVFANLTTQAAYDALFATEINTVGGTKAANTFVMVNNIREFPEIGTPANIVNVPVYGRAMGATIAGQADAPSLEFTLNHVPADWAKGSLLGDAVANGKQYAMRVTFTNADPTGSGATKYASIAAGLGTVHNSSFYFIGKIEAQAVNPQLTDAVTSKVTLSMQSDFYGAYTI